MLGHHTCWERLTGLSCPPDGSQREHRTPRRMRSPPCTSPNCTVDLTALLTTSDLELPAPTCGHTFPGPVVLSSRRGRWERGGLLGSDLPAPGRRLQLVCKLSQSYGWCLDWPDHPGT